MNNKELISTLATKLSLSKSDVTDLLGAFTVCCKEQLLDNNTIGFQSFGTFEINEREEKTSTHSISQPPVTTLPEFVLSFEQSSILKEKLNNQPKL
ncbi:MAG: HU family DNA-binding protein [Paludibacteraceae bacterium]